MASNLGMFRDRFYLGDYEYVITNSQILDLLPTEKEEIDFLVLRSHIEKGSYQIVLDSIDPSSPKEELKAIRLFAQYLSTTSVEEKKNVIALLKVLLGDSHAQLNPNVLLIASHISLYEQNYLEAILPVEDIFKRQLEIGGVENQPLPFWMLELLLLNVKLHLKANQPEKAKCEIKEMTKIDEQSVLTSLAMASAFMHQVDVKAASTIYNNLLHTSTVLNGKAVCSMVDGNFDDAEYPLVVALKKDPDNVESLAILIVNNLVRDINYYYIGAYQAVIENSQTDITSCPNLSPEEAIERDCLKYCSYISLASYKTVIDAINTSSPTELQAVKELALYLSYPKNNDWVTVCLKILENDPQRNKSFVRLIAGTIYMHEKNYTEALKYTQQAGATLEL
ncbi:hypothetical protein LUZ62_053730 [Rhynchospora pubera]|uniref:Coatomer subunit epsilon n=1 Tax=Rhynchospora pubera TaxID=906938 RepID=A0AAV8DSY5_9POAL|nr:hypothetical protein LUZ62_053730 [Rhynchospora pubera]